MHYIPRSGVYSPPRTSCRAMKSAVEPVEQLLLTFTMGMPVRPKLWYMALCPHVESPGGINVYIFQELRSVCVIFTDCGLKKMQSSRHALTIDIPYTGLFNGRIWDSCICQSLFTCNTVTDGEHRLFSQSPTTATMAVGWNKHLLPSPCQGNRSFLWLRACRTAGTKRNRAFILLRTGSVLHSATVGFTGTPLQFDTVDSRWITRRSVQPAQFINMFCLTNIYPVG